MKTLGLLCVKKPFGALKFHARICAKNPPRKKRNLLSAGKKNRFCGCRRLQKSAHKTRIRTVINEKKSVRKLMGRKKLNKENPRRSRGKFLVG